MPDKSPSKNDNPTRVLVIDDDDAMTDMIKHILEPNSFDVSVANSGPEGIKKTRQLNPEVVILDLLMPDMDGWEVCKAIREFSQIIWCKLASTQKSPGPGIVWTPWGFLSGTPARHQWSGSLRPSLILVYLGRRRP